MLSEINRGRKMSKTVPDHLEALEDSANRLERSLDIQDQIISDIDQKAQSTIRIVGVILGLIFTGLSILSDSDLVSNSNSNIATKTGFLVGIALLVAAMAFAIITYLSSKYKIGLDPIVGDLFSRSDFTTNRAEHLRRVNGSYGFNTRVNRRVIEVNSQRFRRTLFCMLSGVLFLSVTGILFVENAGKWVSLVALLATGGIGGLLGWYILGGKYLTVQADEEHT